MPNSWSNAVARDAHSQQRHTGMTLRKRPRSGLFVQPSSLSLRSPVSLCLSLFLLILVLFSLSRGNAHIAQKAAYDLPGQAGPELPDSGSRIWQNARRPSARRTLIKSGGVPLEGFGATLWHFKDAAAIAHVLDLDLRFAQTDPVFGYRSTSIAESDKLFDGTGQICDLHYTVIENSSWGNFEERVERAYAELDDFISSVVSYCEGPMDQPFEMKPHIRDRLKQCDILIWADQRLRGRLGWNNCSRPWYRKAIGGPAQPSKRTVGVHYRHGDMWWNKDGKWIYDNKQIESILSSIRRCKPDYDIAIYIKAASPTEPEEDRLKAMAPIKTYDRLVDTENDLKDLLGLASSDVLIINGGSYSEAVRFHPRPPVSSDKANLQAAAASAARLVIHNGWHPNFYEYLGRNGTKVLNTAEAASSDLCPLLNALD